MVMSFTNGYAKANVKGNKINNAIVPVTRLEYDFYNWEERHKEIIDLTKKRDAQLVFIGDSITHIFGGEPKSKIARGNDIWQQYYSKYNPINMGFGWDRTQNVLWRIRNGELDNISPKVIVLMIGTNNFTGTKNARSNTPQEVAVAIKTICESIHKKLPKTQIILLSILPRTKSFYTNRIKKTNELISKLNKLSYINYLNLYDCFLDKNKQLKKDLMHDKVHPNTKGYKIWAQKMNPLLMKLIKK
jgi:lysophospholipase L1-like esterase